MEKNVLCEKTMQQNLNNYLLKLIGKNNQSNIEFYIDLISMFVNEYYGDESINDDEMSKIMKLFKDYLYNHFGLSVDKEETNVIFHQLVINHCTFIKDIQHLSSIFKKHNK